MVRAASASRMQAVALDAVVRAPNVAPASFVLALRAAGAPR
jgi:hypothetical protein